MKKMLLIFTLLISTLTFSSPALSLEGEGTIDKISVCGTGRSDWTTITYFKLSDGNWFYILGNYVPSGNYDPNHTYSLLMAAYATRYKVKVRATYIQQFESSINCGNINASVGLWNVNGDYIELVEYSQ